MHKNYQGGVIPRLAVVNSLAGYGRCSSVLALPVISVLGVQPCLLPTAILSSHLGFPGCYQEDFTPHMEPYLHAWESIGLTFDGLYCGFLKNETQADTIRKILSGPMMNSKGSLGRSLFLLDPVMGDHGKLYTSVNDGQIDAMRRLASYADILTPNLTEACLLAGQPYCDTLWEEKELSLLCERIAHKSQLPDSGIILTGLERSGQYRNFIWDKGTSYILDIPSAGSAHHGTGDLFASIVAASSLKGDSLLSSVRKACDFISLCIRQTEICHVPPQEGVLLEKCLSALLPPAEFNEI